jgi:flavin-dependent dehydrogenase
VNIAIVGGGPAGAAAALAALTAGARPTIYEKSVFPRHKVCGEFLSPELFPLLDRLHVADDFLALRPAALHRVRLHFGNRVKSWKLDSPAFGLSRHALDDLLLRAALARGAGLRREAVSDLPPGAVVAYGRRTGAGKGRRLFGFKAHFTGPVDDAVDLVFFGRCYAGISAVEAGRVNICGLAPEPVLRAHGFEPDSVLASSPVFRDRLRPLTRVMDWLITGPLVFRDAFDERVPLYPSGDALGFVDPFTGSGILSAVLTGGMAGRAAAEGLDPSFHLRRCREALGLQYRTSGTLRRLIASGWAERLAGLVPGRLLFGLTRPKVRA